MSYLDKSALRLVGTSPIRPDGVDKVTGRANFGADMTMPGMLWGKLKRSPHAHARIKSINTSKAEKLPGVRAVVTAADFPDIASEEAFVGEGPMNFRDLSYNCMARGKVLYDGHAVAAVAATSPAIAEEALDLIEVDYEVLPHVIDVEDAMKPRYNNILPPQVRQRCASLRFDHRGESAKQVQHAMGKLEEILRVERSRRARQPGLARFVQKLMRED